MGVAIRWIRVLVVGGLFGAVFLASPVERAWAQEEQWAISFSGGFAMPAGGAFGEQWDRGNSLMLGVSRIGSKYELGGEFGHFQFEPAGDSIAVPGVRPGENEWEMWRLRFRMRRMFAGSEAKIAPFLVTGLGIYPITVSSSDSTGTFQVTTSGNGVSIGAGVDFRAGESVHFGLEGQYHYIRVSRDIVGYRASPLVEILFAIRWLPGAGGT